jgi:hypothetical protein
MSAVAFNGTKRDVTLSEGDLQVLQSGGYTYILIGNWDDGTPAYVKLALELPVSKAQPK